MKPFLFAALMVLQAARLVAGPAAPVPFETDRREALLKPLAVAQLGSGFATHAALAGDVLAVATTAGASGGPGLRAGLVDLYRLGTNGMPEFLTTIQSHTAIRFVSLSGARLYVADAVGVSAYQINSKKGTAAFAWKYALEGLDQVTGAIPGALLLRTATTMQLARDVGNACIPETRWKMSSRHLVGASVPDRYFVLGSGGACQLYNILPDRRIEFLADVPLFGNVRWVEPRGAMQSLVLDADTGLRLYNTKAFARSRRDQDAQLVPRSLSAPGVKAQFVLDELPVKDGTSFQSFGEQVFVLHGAGQLGVTQIDAKTSRFSPLKPVKDLGPVAEVAGDAKRQVAVGRDGSVTMLANGGITAKLPTRQTGPMLAMQGQLFVADGPALMSVVGGSLAKEVYRDEGAILKIATQGPTVYLLSTKQLTAAKFADGKLSVLGTLAMPTNASLLRLGPTHAGIVHDGNHLMLVDIRDPAKLKQVADRPLELPTRSESRPSQPPIRDVVIEARRVLVVGTEVFIYELEKLVSPAEKVTWKSVWNRPYKSVDEMLPTTSITALGEERYLVTSSYSFNKLPLTRAYVLTLKDDSVAAWRYCRLGAGSAQDVKLIAPGVIAIAAGDDGLRLLGMGADDAYLGSRREPGEDCQAVVSDGDKLYAKAGNTIRTFQYQLRATKEDTTYTFAPKAADKPPKVMVDGVDVTSEAYRVAMGYRNRLKLQPTDLSDKAGFPAVTVPQGTVAVDAKLGRLKFADGRNREPEFVSRTEYINVRLAGWRKAGPYAIAAMSEQSQGLGVMDLSDPTNMKILSVAGQPPHYAYPHTILGYRDGFAYMTGNFHDNFLQTVNMKDPKHPFYERMIRLENGAVLKFSCPTHVSGFFRGNRLFVPGVKGTTEVDITDPTRVERVTVHTNSHSIHQVLAERNRAMRWLDGRLEFLDITDIANPKVLGAYPAKGKVDFSPGITVTDRDHTWVMTPGKVKDKQLVCIEHKDMKAPALASKTVIPEDTAGILPDGDYVYLSGMRSFRVLDCRQPKAPKEIAALDELAFVGAWKYSFMEDQPRVSVVAGKDMEGLNIELKDGNTVWVTSFGATYGINVADPQHPKVVGGGPGFGESWWIRSDDSDLVSIGSYRRLFVDIANPKKPRALMEQWTEHPLRCGFPCSGGWGQYHVATDTVWKWERNPKTGLFDLQRDVLLPVWVGPDPEYRVADRPVCMIASAGRSATQVRSVTFDVKPGERLEFKGFARTLPYQEFELVRSAEQTPNNEVTFAAMFEGRKAQAWAYTHDRQDGVLYRIERSFIVPPKMDKLIFQVGVKGQAWVADLQLLRGGENLLKNGSFDQPFDVTGQHPGWTTIASGDRANMASFDDGEVLYAAQGHDVFLYDLKKKSLYPTSRVAAAVDAGTDGPIKIEVRKEGARKLAYVLTQQGLVTLDVTDLHRPYKLGAIAIPWLRGRNPYCSLWRNYLVASQGYGSDPLTEGFYVIDVKDPGQPVLRSFVEGRRHSGVVCHNGYVILGDYDQGMQIWDIRNPDRPEMITDQGYERCSQTWSMDYHGNYALRNEVGGLELWETPIPPQAPEGKVTVE